SHHTHTHTHTLSRAARTGLHVRERDEDLPVLPRALLCQGPRCRPITSSLMSGPTVSANHELLCVTPHGVGQSRALLCQGPRCRPIPRPNINGLKQLLLEIKLIIST